MRLDRRRFIAIAAAASLAGPAAIRPQRAVWRGAALGAEAEIAVEGEGAGPALAAAREALARVEQLFSLYDPGSALSRLNRDGRLATPAEFGRLVGVCAEAHRLTGGLFDPTVQPLFAAMLRKGGRLDAGEFAEIAPLLGWEKVAFDGARLELPSKGMALTFNGVAQGFAADRVVETLASHGFDRTAVNVGEWRSTGLPVRLDVRSPEGRSLGDLVLTGSAVATSSPGGYRFADGSGHILRANGADGVPSWRTVSVEVEIAAMADALSTGVALSPDETLARSLVALGAARSILLEDFSGRIVRL